jgi:hypothetical protein
MFAHCQRSVLAIDETQLFGLASSFCQVESLSPHLPIAEAFVEEDS